MGKYTKKAKAPEKLKKQGKIPVLTGESDPPQLVLEKLDGVVGRGSHTVKLVEWD